MQIRAAAVKVVQSQLISNNSTSSLSAAAVSFSAHSYGQVVIQPCGAVKSKFSRKPQLLIESNQPSSGIPATPPLFFSLSTAFAFAAPRILSSSPVSSTVRSRVRLTIHHQQQEIPPDFLPRGSGWAESIHSRTQFIASCQFFFWLVALFFSCAIVPSHHIELHRRVGCCTLL
jgi:hypothetical protein